jgi:uncharacterized protein YdaU (DUF1376 family)
LGILLNPREALSSRGLFQNNKKHWIPFKPNFQENIPMSKREQLPYMPFFVGDYLKETRRLTTEEHGAYVLLILEYWAKGGNLPDDDVQLARIVGLKLPTWRKMRPVIEAFFHDGWQHEGLDKQLIYAADRKERARRAALARYSEQAEAA